MGKRVALLAGAVVVALLLGEALLQLGAWGVRISQRGPDTAGTSALPRIVCLGDSNTYGLYLEPEQAWPRMLEARLKPRAGSESVEVLNLGYPGTNSSTVLREFPRILSGVEPDAVLVLVGANDFWTVPAASQEGRSWLAAAADSVKRHSRLYRIVSMLRSRGTGHGVVVPEVVPDPSIERRPGTVRVGEEHFELGFEGRKVKAPSDAVALAGNLRELIALARADGVPLFLVTYPWDEQLYGAANEIIRGVARDREAPLLDLADRFRELCTDDACTELFFPDRHPTAAGHERMAEALAPALSSLFSIRE